MSFVIKKGVKLNAKQTENYVNNILFMYSEIIHNMSLTVPRTEKMENAIEKCSRFFAEEQKKIRDNIVSRDEIDIYTYANECIERMLGKARESEISNEEIISLSKYFENFADKYYYDRIKFVKDYITDVPSCKKNEKPLKYFCRVKSYRIDNLFGERKEIDEKTKKPLIYSQEQMESDIAADNVNYKGVNVPKMSFDAIEYNKPNNRLGKKVNYKKVYETYNNALLMVQVENNPIISKLYDRKALSDISAILQSNFPLDANDRTGFVPLFYLYLFTQGVTLSDITNGNIDKKYADEFKKLTYSLKKDDEKQSAIDCFKDIFVQGMKYYRAYMHHYKDSKYLNTINKFVLTNMNGPLTANMCEPMDGKVCLVDSRELQVQYDIDIKRLRDVYLDFTDPSMSTPAQSFFESLKELKKEPYKISKVENAVQNYLKYRYIETRKIPEFAIRNNVTEKANEEIINEFIESPLHTELNRIQEQAGPQKLNEYKLIHYLTEAVLNGTFANSIQSTPRASATDRDICYDLSGLNIPTPDVYKKVSVGDMVSKEYSTVLSSIKKYDMDFQRGKKVSRVATMESVQKLCEKMQTYLNLTEQYDVNHHNSIKYESVIESLREVTAVECNDNNYNDFSRKMNVLEGNLKKYLSEYFTFRLSDLGKDRKEIIGCLEDMVGTINEKMKEHEKFDVNELVKSEYNAVLASVKADNAEIKKGKINTSKSMESIQDFCNRMYECLKRTNNAEHKDSATYRNVVNSLEKIMYINPKTEHLNTFTANVSELKSKLSDYFMDHSIGNFTELGRDRRRIMNTLSEKINVIHKELKDTENLINKRKDSFYSAKKKTVKGNVYVGVDKYTFKPSLISFGKKDGNFVRKNVSKLTNSYSKNITHSPVGLEGLQAGIKKYFTDTYNVIQSYGKFDKYGNPTGSKYYINMMRSLEEFVDCKPKYFVKTLRGAIANLKIYVDKRKDNDICMSIMNVYRNLGALTKQYNEVAKHEPTRLKEMEEVEKAVRELKENNKKINNQVAAENHAVEDIKIDNKGLGDIKIDSKGINDIKIDKEKVKLNEKKVINNNPGKKVINKNSVPKNESKKHVGGEASEDVKENSIETNAYIDAINKHPASNSKRKKPKKIDFELKKML